MKLKNISKSYGDERVLENVSLEIPKGETIVISGPSGRGKTTLLRIMMGLEEPDNGEISGAPKRISAVFQENRLPLEFTAERCVKLALPKSISDSEICRHLSELGLTEHIKKPVSELSGGMKRRVAICRGVLAPSDAIYMDEPFTGLDIETKVQVIEYLKKYCAGKTLVVVSHAAEDAELLNAKEIRI